MEQKHPAPPPSQNEDSLRGFLFALTAYLLWGFMPIYMKALAHMSPAEVIAHRVLWSIPVAGLVLVVLGRTADVSAALRNPRMLAMSAVTAMLITFNWGLYVWAIGAGRALDTALGYYINPLFSVALGALLLGERLHRLQIAAIALAALAVLILTYEVGSMPWVSLGLTFSWGFYAFFKKSLPIGPNQGFFLEVLILTPPALIYVIYLQATGNAHFMQGEAMDTALLVGCGLVTALPLMIYANGAKLLRLSTIGMMQYIAPTMIFLVAIFVFDEPLEPARRAAFAIIWVALVLFSWSMFHGRKR